MPGRNIVKVLINDSFYHLYNRGVNRAEIFIDNEDYSYFEWLLARNLNSQPLKDARGRRYNSLYGSVELNAYCLMPNHFHFLTYRLQQSGTSKLMHTLALSYAGYFNKKYKRRGPLFENSYRAVRIESESQLLHVSRYIHLNHRDFRTWPHSSFSDYLSSPRSWITPSRVLNLFSSQETYRAFTLDYEQAQRENESIKREMAGY